MDQQYWDKRYRENETGWDVGYASPPLTEYIDQLPDKTMRILIPGCGNAYEGAYLHRHGFANTYLLDISKEAVNNVKSRFPDIPEGHIIHDDFFRHRNTYDLILEQTFFCALEPARRKDYVVKAHSLLEPDGKVAGVLFASEFEAEGPPFGGTKEEYEELFAGLFQIEVMETARNSIKPRQGNELFFVLGKKSLTK